MRFASGEPVTPALSSAAAETACQLCGGPTVPAFVTGDRNRAITRLAFRYRRCSACRSYSLVDVPPDLSVYYPEEYYALPTLAGLRAQALHERYRMDILARHARTGRLTEIGAGSGIFAIQALDAGFDTAAIELDAGACAYLRETLGIEVVQTAAPEEALAAMAPSRVIAAWHVLEHVPRPWALLEAAAANLEPGGVLVVATPNPRSFGLRALGGRWPHVDAPRHLFLIDHEALVSRAASVGLDLVELTDVDPGGLHWNEFGWHYLLRPPGASPIRERLAQIAGRGIARVLAPVERRGLRGAAYTAVLLKR